MCGGIENFLDADPTDQFPDASFLWSTGSTASTTGIEESGLYSVTISNACFSASDTLNIEFTSDLGLWVPSAFTPNGDGLNDDFSIGTLNLGSFRIVIFDRWGKKLFESDSPIKAWDGTHKGQAVPMGVYTYLINFTDCAARPDQRGGSVTVIR